MPKLEKPYVVLVFDDTLNGEFCFESGSDKTAKFKTPEEAEEFCDEMRQKVRDLYPGTEYLVFKLVPELSPVDALFT